MDLHVLRYKKLYPPVDSHFLTTQIKYVAEKYSIRLKKRSVKMPNNKNATYLCQTE